MKLLGFLSLILIEFLGPGATPSWADTQTLPQGVRALVFRHASARVPGTYGNDGRDKGFGIEQDLTATILKDISSDTETAYNELFSVDPHLANTLNLGKINVTPRINVVADAYALAWGLRDNLMIVGALPVMQASVNLDGGFYATNSLQHSLGVLQAYINDSSHTDSQRSKAQALFNVLSSGLPTPSGEYLEGAIVNDYHYKPVGNWYASGLGDAQLFSIYRFISFPVYHQAIKLGEIFPTGRQKDPDNLLDIPFGKGYNSTFVESMHQWQLLPELLSFSGSAMYQYNWAADRTFRLAPSRTFPLSEHKEAIHYKPGNIWGLGAEISSKLFHFLELSTSWEFRAKALDQILGKDKNYDYTILSDETNYRSHTLEFGAAFSTVDLFLRKKFFLPLKIGATFSRVVSGINTERVNITSLNLEAYF